MYSNVTCALVSTLLFRACRRTFFSVLFFVRSYVGKSLFFHNAFTRIARISLICFSISDAHGVERLSGIRRRGWDGSYFEILLLQSMGLPRQRSHFSNFLDVHPPPTPFRWLVKGRPERDWFSSVNRWLFKTRNLRGALKTKRVLNNGKMSEKNHSNNYYWTARLAEEITFSVYLFSLFFPHHTHTGYYSFFFLSFTPNDSRVQHCTFHRRSGRVPESNCFPLRAIAAAAERCANTFFLFHARVRDTVLLNRIDCCSTHGWMLCAIRSKKKKKIVYLYIYISVHVYLWKHSVYSYIAPFALTSRYL